MQKQEERERAQRVQAEMLGGFKSRPFQKAEAVRNAEA